MTRLQVFFPARKYVTTQSKQTLSFAFGASSLLHWRTMIPPIGGQGGGVSPSSPRRIVALSNECSRPASRSSRPILTARMMFAGSSGVLGSQSPLANPFETWGACQVNSPSSSCALAATPEPGCNTDPWRISRPRLPQLERICRRLKSRSIVASAARINRRSGPVCLLTLISPWS